MIAIKPKMLLKLFCVLSKDLFIIKEFETFHLLRTSFAFDLVHSTYFLPKVIVSQRLTEISRLKLRKLQRERRLKSGRVVDRIWLDNQCHINFRLRNASEGRIPYRQYRQGGASVYFGEEGRESFSFTGKCNAE